MSNEDGFNVKLVESSGRKEICHEVQTEGPRECHTDLAEVTYGTVMAGTDVDLIHSGDPFQGISFADELKILCIRDLETRVICHFLKEKDAQNIKMASKELPKLTSFIMMQCLMEFMLSNQYEFCGEINFVDGSPVPVTKKTWFIHYQEHTFTREGIMFFKGRKNVSNVVAHVADLRDGNAIVHFFTSNTLRSEQIVRDLEQYAKKHNCLRDAKLRNVDLQAATFVEVIPSKDHTWDKLYYPKSVKDIFELEVFSFLQDTAKYNAKGIRKRGIMLFGVPGTGKTSIGYILSKYLPGNAVIWVTPEILVKNPNVLESLYILMDFLSPAVIILEDIDLIGEDRSGLSDLVRLGIIMNILDGVNSIDNVVTLAMTNRIDMIEKALSRRPGRFDRIIEIPALTKKSREIMIRDRFNVSNVDISNEVVKLIVDKTDTFTGAELQEFINTTHMHFIANGNGSDQDILTKDIAEDVLTKLNKFSLNGNNKSVGFSSEG